MTSPFDILRFVRHCELKESELTILEIEKLTSFRIELLDKYGVFGGGNSINQLFQRINTLVKD